MFGGGGQLPSFNPVTFGGTQQVQPTANVFGTTAGQQPTFAGFGQQQPTSGFGTTFGQPQQQNTGLLGTPSFGSTAFGQPQQQQQQQQPTTGFSGFSGFGQPQQQQQQTSTFSGFGQTQPQQQTTTFSSFGQPQPQQTTGAFTGFGQQPTINTFAGFGQTQPQQQTSTFSGFGPQPQQPATSAFPGFGQTQQQPTSTFPGFGQQPAISTFSGFGQTQQQPTSTFSGFGQQQQQPATSTFGGFGTTFGSGQQQPVTSFSFPTQTTTTATNAFNFNTGTTAGQPNIQIGVAQPFSFPSTKPLTTAAPFSFSTPAFGQPQQTSSLFQPLQPQQSSITQPTFSFQTQPQQPFQFQQLQQQQVAQPQPTEDNHAFFQSIFQCHKFGDERDAILANLNFLQAGWGRGKGHYSQTFPPVTYTPANPLYRFKSVSYAFIQTDNNEDGFVTFDVKKPEEKARQEEANLISALQSMFGRPNIFFKVEGMKRIDGNTTMVNLFAEDKNTLRRVPATELAAALLQPHFKPHLDSLMIMNVLAKIRPSPEQLKRYLEDAPQGFDPRTWRKAQEDNPDSAHMIPVPIVGIDALKKRAAVQESESHQHMTRLELIDEDITTLQNRHTNMKAELQQLKRKQSELVHRVLKVILRQEMTRKDGTTIQPEEEELNKLVVNLEEKISTPAEFRGRLNELISRARLKVVEDGEIRYSMDDQTLVRIKSFLETQQESIQSIANTIHDDLDQLQHTAESLSELVLGKPSSRPFPDFKPEQ